MFEKYRIKGRSNSFLARFTRWSNDKISVALIGVPYYNEGLFTDNDQNHCKPIHFHIHKHNQPAHSPSLITISEQYAKKRKMRRKSQILRIPPTVGCDLPQYIPPMPELEDSKNKPVNKRMQKPRVRKEETEMVIEGV